MGESAKVIVRSFRIKKETFVQLADAAGHDKRSLNSIVNDVLDQYVDYERGLVNAKVVHIGSGVLTFLTQSIPKEKIVEFAKTYAHDTIEGRIEGRTNMTKDELLKALRDHCKYNSMRLVEAFHDSKRVLILVHDIGLNYSMFVATYYQTLFEDIGVKTEYSTDDHAVVLRFA